MKNGNEKENELVINIGHEQLVIERIYEVIGIANEICIGLWFVIGSFFFFSNTLVTAGTWLFVTGSVQMLVKPIIKITKLIHLKKRFNKPSKSINSIKPTP